MEKCFSVDAFVMGHHVYNEIWTAAVGEEFNAGMQPDYVKDKHTVAVYQKGKKVIIGQLPLGNLGKFAKAIFYFLKTCKEDQCKIVITANVVRK